ncbi:hypothetical protein RUND412_008297 [Rhizina undulata]
MQPLHPTPLVKTILTHHAPAPTPSPNPSTSPHLIPTQTLRAIFTSNPTKKGRFLLFHRQTRTLPTIPSPAPPFLIPADANLATVDVCRAHEYEVLPTGTLRYNGRTTDLESTLVRTWTRDGALNRLIPPETQRYRFALFGPGNHASFETSIPAAAGSGSWEKLVREREQHSADQGRSTHVMCIALPELVGHILAMGTVAEEAPGVLRQGDWGTVRILGGLGEWGEPVVGAGREPREEWKKGWWWTGREGMDVWIS